MKQILLGYKDRDGQNAPTVICGPDAAPADLAKIFNRADREHVFPEGIQRLERVNLEVVQMSVFINASVTEHLKHVREDGEKLIKDRAAAMAAETAQQRAGKETGEALRRAVIARNAILGDKLKAEVKLRNLLATPESLQIKNYKGLCEDASAELEAIKTKVTTAVEDYNKAFAAHEAAKNPQPKASAETAKPAEAGTTNTQ